MIVFGRSLAGLISLGVVGCVIVLLVVVMVVLGGIKVVWVRSMVLRMLFHGFQNYIILQCTPVEFISCWRGGLGLAELAVRLAFQLLDLLVFFLRWLVLKKGSGRSRGVVERHMCERGPNLLGADVQNCRGVRMRV